MFLALLSNTLLLSHQYTKIDESISGRAKVGASIAMVFQTPANLSIRLYSCLNFRFPKTDLLLIVFENLKGLL